MFRALSSARGRIIVGFGFLVLILVGVAAGSAWQVHEHQSDTAAMEEHADTAFVLQNAQVNAEAAAAGLQRYVIVGDETRVVGDEILLPEIRSQIAEAEESLARALADTEMRGDREQAARLYQISAEADSIIAGVEMIIALQQSGDVQAAATAMEVTVLPFREFEDKLEAAAETELQQVSTLRSQADTTGQVAFLLLIVSGATGAVLGVATSIFVARSIIKPLSSLEETATAVSQGDLQARAQATGPRELAHLGAALNQMTESLLDASKRRELEEALRESETKLRTLAETMATTAFIHQDGRFRYVNSATEALTGHTRKELLAMNFWEVIHPDFREMVKGRGLARQRGEQVLSRYEVKIVTKSGDERWIDIAATTSEFEGKPAVLGTALDITERKRAEEAVRESEERYRELFENANDIVYTYTFDPPGKITSLNKTGERVTGYTLEELSDLRIAQFAPPEYHERVAEVIKRQFAGEAPTTIEVEIIAKDGRRVPLETNPRLIVKDGKPVAVHAIARDVTERRRAEEAVRESEKRFRDITEHAAEWVWEVDASGKYTYASPVVERILGYKPEEVLGKHFYDLFHPEDREELKKAALEAFAQKQPLSEFTNRNIRKDGSVVWLSTSGVPVLDEHGNLLGYRGADTDITDRKQAEETIRHLAYHDALTELPNRTLFKDRLTQAIAQARRKGRTLAVLFLDLDHFKVINDTVGHAEGDRLLQRVAHRLRGLVREGDTVARVGGDEFILLLSEASRMEDATQVSERILESCRSPWALQEQEFLVTASIGIAMYPGDGDDAESLLQNADTAMYRAKEQGRNNYQLYTPAMNARIVERLALENSLRSGLERGEFVVYYQPQINIRTGQVVGVEALLRWQHPERGLVLPAEFIPVAEETGLIMPLGEWVLRTACAQNKAWQEAGLPPLRVAVNLSARQFQQRNLIDIVAQALQETGLDPHWLALEITEGVAMQDVDFTVTMMQGLREMGVQIAIDDFGTGYSSLAYLKRFPIDAVKIDRSFVCDLMVDPNDAAIVTTVITMAHSLKLSVIAEGVETEEQIAFLKQQQCDEMQGFLFSKAVPAQELGEILAHGRRRSRSKTPVDSA